MNKLKILDWISLILVIIGGLNWGLVGIFKFDLVSYLFDSIPVLMTVIYILVGLGALYMLVISPKLARK